MADPFWTAITLCGNQKHQHWILAMSLSSVASPMTQERPAGRGVILGDEKRCHSCKKWKPLSDFYSEASAPCGYSSKCQLCKRKYHGRKYNLSIEGAVGAMVRSYRQTHKGRSKRRRELALSFNLKSSDLLDLWYKQGGLCAVTGIEMTHIRGSGYCVMENVSLDRIDASRGYEKDNVRLVCKAVNYMKNSMKDEDMVKWANAIKNGPVALRMERQ